MASSAASTSSAFHYAAANSRQPTDLVAPEDEVIYRSVGVLPASAGGALAMPSLRSASAWDVDEHSAGTAALPAKKSLDALAFPSWAGIPSVSKPTTSSSALAAIHPRAALPAEPCYVEPTSFTLHADAAFVLDTIAALFDARNDVVCTVLADQYRMKCVLLPSAAPTPNAELVEFRVHLFCPNAATTAANAVLVEFQRRTGSSLLFSPFVRTMRAQLEQKFNGATTVVLLPTLPMLSSDLALPSLLSTCTTSVDSSSSSQPSSPVVATPAESVMSTLLEMSICDSLTSSQEGWAMLAHLCHSENPSSYLSSPQTVASLVSALVTVFESPANLPVRVYAAQVLHGLAGTGSAMLQTALITNVLAPAALVAFSLRVSPPTAALEDELLQRELLRAVTDALNVLRAANEDNVRSVLAAAADARSQEPASGCLARAALGAVAVPACSRVLVK